MSQPVQKATGESHGLSQPAARRLEYSIIGLGLFALVLIFQPFSLALFGAGCALVVLSGLINNLLPLCQPGIAIRTLMNTGLIIAFIFCIVMLLSITAAYLYGAYFVNAIAPDTSEPFYRQPFVWTVAAVTIALAAVIALSNRMSR